MSHTVCSIDQHSGIVAKKVCIYIYIIYIYTYYITSFYKAIVFTRRYKEYFPASAGGLLQAFDDFAALRLWALGFASDPEKWGKTLVTSSD